LSDKDARSDSSGGRSEGTADGRRPRIALVGLDPIGVAVGRALRAVRTDYTVTGHDSSAGRVRAALDAGAIDSGEWSLGRAVEDADLIVLCEPEERLLETMETIAAGIPPGCAMTTVSGRLSAAIRRASEVLPGGVSFVAGRVIPAEPLDASDSAAEGALVGATWCLAPSPGAEEAAVRVLGRLVEAVGARALYIDPDEHDALAAGAARLPAVVFAALASVLGRSPSADDIRQLTDPELRAVLGRDQAGSAAEASSEALVLWLDQLQRELEVWRAAIEAGDELGLQGLEAAAAADRERWRSPERDRMAEDTAAELRQMGGLRQALFGRRRRMPRDG